VKFQLTYCIYISRGDTTHEMGNEVKGGFVSCTGSRVLYNQREGTLS